MTRAALSRRSLPASDRAAAWRATHEPRWFWDANDACPRMRRDLAVAFEQAILGFASRPNTFALIELRGEKLSMIEIINHVWRCTDVLPPKTATVLSSIDTFNGERWLNGKMTYAQAALFLRGVTVN